MSEIFRGHVEECLRHLGLKLYQGISKGSRGAAEAKRPMADFCRVTVDTTTRWLNDPRHLPVGEVYIRLVCFLSINGYKVLELERMKPKVRNFARLIGFGLVTSQEAAEMLNYSQVSTLFQVLRGDHGATEGRGEKMWDMWQVRKDKLDKVVEDATEKYRLSFLNPPIQPDVLSSTSSEVRVTTGCPRDGVINIMQGLLSLLDAGTLQNPTDADWVALRGSSGTILRLSSHLSTLSAQLVKSS